MVAQRLNVLVYNGAGASIDAVRQCVYSLRRFLSPNYAVLTVTGSTITNEPWAPTCALLVMPGGADLGYCKTLNGDGNRRIRQYVQQGGAYMGFCAGGYYGTSCCEFEVGDKSMEVVGARELSLYPGVSRGSAFKGFVYNSEAGTRAAELRVNRAAFSTFGTLSEVFRCYFNGGSVFVDASKYTDKGVEILATYNEALDVSADDDLQAAVVYCKVGEGAALLTGPHPEFAAVNISKGAKDMKSKVVDQLTADDKQRAEFLRACLMKLGLNINKEEQSLPALSTIHVSSAREGEASSLLSAWRKIATQSEGDWYLQCEVDTYRLHQPESMSSVRNLTKTLLRQTLADTSASIEQAKPETSDSIINYDEVIKALTVSNDGWPSINNTPYFNHELYYSSLKLFNKKCGIHPQAADIGRCLLYGEVITSTSTLLDKNPILTQTLPQGTTFTATTQLAGKGRGSNVWISPAGSLKFSTVIRHPLTLNVRAPVVFIQYLAAIAIVKAVHSYGKVDGMTGDSNEVPSYRDLPVRLKWPNDIYALDPSLKNADPSQASSYVKIGGILVNSSYSGGDYTLIVGTGLNMSNAAPTTSLNALLNKVNKDAAMEGHSQTLAPFTEEKLLAAILSNFAATYERFKTAGFAGSIEQEYYKYWLHSEQLVTLEAEGGVRARIKGVTTDWGLLRAQEEYDGRPSGKEFALQTDSNSFDFFKGLLKRKL